MEQRIEGLKSQLLSAIEAQFADIKSADSKELGEAMDMLKDLSEFCYYTTVTESMKKNSDSKNEQYMNKYLPETQRYYTRPMMMDDRYDTAYRNRMYYSTIHNTNDGRAYISRRGYMEASDQDSKYQELEKYMHDLADDISEMVIDMDDDDKVQVKHKLTQLIQKIV